MRRIIYRRGACWRRITRIQNHSRQRRGRGSQFAAGEEEEGKAEEEEEAESKTEVEGTTLLIHMEGATVKITATAKAASKVDNRMHKDKGMISPMSNVTIVNNMVIMLMNVERSSKEWQVELEKISLRKISTKIICF